MVALYGGKTGDTLNELRFHLFAKSLVKSNFNLASLPPTMEAARQHCFRVYMQVQMWLGNQMNPLNWGWQASKFGLAPIPTTREPAPQSLLTTISCKCTKGCAAACSCRKTGIKCSAICANCKGHSCHNAPNADELEDTVGDEDELTEQMIISSETEDDPMECEDQEGEPTSKGSRLEH